MRIAAALCLLVALLLARPPALWRVRWRLAARPAGGIGIREVFSRSSPPVIFVVLIFVVLTFAGGPAHLIVGFTAIAVAGVVVKLRGRAVRAARSRRRSAEVAEAIGALAAELDAGALAGQALQRLAADAPILEPAATAARLGGDVSGALRATARSPGAERLEDLAAGWEVSQRSGAPMARVLDRLCEGLRVERDTQREIDAGIGPAKATARLMAVLPLLGLGLAAGIGSDPIHILLGTVAGSICLAAGALLGCAGVIWVEAIAARAVRT